MRGTQSIVLLVSLAILLPSVLADYQCGRRICDQMIEGRNLDYASALRILQNEEYLQAADTSVVSHKRKKRQTFYIFENGQQVGNNQNSTIDLNFLTPQAGLVILLTSLSYLIIDYLRPGTFVAEAPLDQPQPGSPGGGRSPLGLEIPEVQLARSLVPHGLAPVAVFPPFSPAERTYDAVGVIFNETPIQVRKKRETGEKRGILQKISDFVWGIPEVIRHIRIGARSVRRKFETRFLGFPNRRNYEETSEYSDTSYGFRALVTLVDEACQLDVTCDAYGNSLGHHYTHKRSIDDQISATAPPQCRTIKSPPGTC